MYVARVADPNREKAFFAYSRLISPALRHAAATPLRQARHHGRPCLGPDGKHWCPDCEQVIDDHLLTGFNRLRATLAGNPPTTNGHPVREMIDAATWLSSTEATHLSLDLTARRLRRPPTPADPPGLRATRAQLIHYVLTNLAARVRRDDAAAKGLSTRPDRALRTSAWAAPLRADPDAFTLLLDAITRLRNGATNPYDIPPHQLPPNLDLPTARTLLRNSLTALRTLHPAFHHANITLPTTAHTPLTDHDTLPVQSPEDLLLQAEAATEAQTHLSTLLTTPTYRPLLTAITANTPQPAPALITTATKILNIPPAKATTLIRNLIKLATQAAS
ncbi:hypothetical protein AB0K60_29180 [Thermopolyspora sp. NPDC052614]|uniref:hypothetical protein n=1 Tax=Thermopolyspora sp. NPDC052614 TaxID=3155682 RepID=UPI003428EFAC